MPANVQADWEGVGAAVLAAIAVAVFAIGVLRSVRRRRRDRAAAAETTTDAADTPVDSAAAAAETTTDAADAHEPPSEPEQTAGARPADPEHAETPEERPNG